MAKKPADTTDEPQVEFATTPPGVISKGEVTFGNPAEADAKKAADKKEDQEIEVQALRTFFKDENMTGEQVTPDSPPFTVNRLRAAQLRANGLVRYTDSDLDGKEHGDKGAQLMAERDAREAEMRELPEKHKGTPLMAPNTIVFAPPAEATAKK